MLFQSSRRAAVHLGIQISKRNFASGAVYNLSDLDAVEKFTTAADKCVLYYTAKWCGPCRQIGPIYEELAKANDSVKLGKVDVDENQDAAAEAQIAVVPTFHAYYKNEIVQTVQGADPNNLKQMVENLKNK